MLLYIQPSIEAERQTKQLCECIRMWTYPRSFFPSLQQTEDFSKYFAKYFELANGIKVKKFRILWKSNTIEKNYLSFQFIEVFKRFHCTPFTEHSRKYFKFLSMIRENDSSLLALLLSINSHILFKSIHT